MNPILSSSTSYRVKVRWPESSPNWRYVPEHADLTLKRAREVAKENGHWVAAGMQLRIVMTKTVETIVPSKYTLEEYLLGDFQTTLRKVNYDKCWHLVRGNKVKRISPNRAAALKGAFLRDPCRITPLIEL